MAKPLPSRFNPDLMARDGTRYAATVPLAQFKRFGPILASMEGDVHVSAVFSRRKDHIVVCGEVSAGLTVQCQRCLDVFVQPIESRYELVFVDSEAAARVLPDDLDPVIIEDGGQIHIVDLLEDELILQVPLVTRHPDGQCVAAQRSFGDIAPQAAEPTEDNRQRPFDVLKNLNLH
jgi:uncharacterized protein